MTRLVDWFLGIDDIVDQVMVIFIGTISAAVMMGMTIAMIAIIGSVFFGCECEGYYP